ncbi:unnamed protein product [Urochloa decumbens]|uniref:DUF6598 domain-containing protein n=1 Tax=Urochloa decumbens TaxID=240449 RepID=A0ABC9AZA7_9POAL
MVNLRRILANHQSQEDILDRHGNSILSSSRQHPLLAVRYPEQPARWPWLHVKLQVAGEKKQSTTLVIRGDNLCVYGFKNRKGVWYELLLETKGKTVLSKEAYNNPVPQCWGHSYTTILEADDDNDAVGQLMQSVKLGKNFATNAILALSCYPDTMSKHYMRPRLALVSLMIMVCDSARMNPVHDAIVVESTMGQELTDREKVMMSAAGQAIPQLQISPDNVEQKTTPGPSHQQQAEVKMVPSVVYSIDGDELSFISFMMELRRILANHSDHEDIFDHHPDSNLSSSREHPLLAKQSATQPSRWLEVELKVVEGKETLSTTLLMRDDNLYVLGFMNQKGEVYGLHDKSCARMLPSKYKPKQLGCDVSYRSLLGAESRREVVETLTDARLGRCFAVDAVRVLSCFPEWVDGTDMDPVIALLRGLDGRDMNPMMALAGLIFMVCESARMNVLHNLFADGWGLGKFGDTRLTPEMLISKRKKTKEMLECYVWNYGKMSSDLRTWMSNGYAKSRDFSSHKEVSRTDVEMHPISQLQDVYLVLNCYRPDPPRGGYAKSRGGHRDGANSGQGGAGDGGAYGATSRHRGGASRGGHGSTNRHGASSSGGHGATSSHGAGGGAHGASSRQNDAGGPSLGRRRVELLAMRADLKVVGTTIMVFDGKRGQIIYEKEEQGDREQGMIDLVLTGPNKGISANGCFAIKIDIPATTTAGSSSGDAGGSIYWKWDCYDPEFAEDVDKPQPVRRTISSSSSPGRNVEVTYAVLSSALEATAQVKLHLKDGHSPRVHGNITARIGGFEAPSILFRREKETGQRFYPTDSRFLELARSVVAVPCGRMIHIEVDLQIETSINQGASNNSKPLKFYLNFDSGIPDTQCYEGYDGDNVEVMVTWYPEIQMTTRPQPDIREISYTVGDEGEGFRRFITELRSLVADHPRRKDILEDHPDEELSSTRNHPVLAMKGRLLRIKLQAETSSTTLLIGDHCLSIYGFMNQSGDWYGLRYDLTMFAPGYDSIRLDWDLDRGDIIRFCPDKNSMAYAVHVLSCYPHLVADGGRAQQGSLGTLARIIFGSTLSNQIMLPGTFGSTTADEHPVWHYHVWA